MQFGGIVYNSRTAGALAAGAANNGLSVSGGIVQLGGPLGSAAAANLLNNREVPLNGFGLLFSGFSATGRILFKEAAPGLTNNVHILGQDVTAAEIFRLTYSGNVAGDQGSIFMGRLAGNAQTNLGAPIMIGWRCGQLSTTGGHLTLMGYEAAFNITTADFCSVFGANALLNATTGGGHAAFGTSALFNVTIGTNNSAFGEASGQGFSLGSSFNCAFGANAGNWTGAIFAAFNLCIIIGSGAFNTNTQLPTGGLISIGANTGNQNFATGTNSILIGTAIVLTAAINNTTVVGAGVSIGTANVCVLGTSTQHNIFNLTVVAAAQDNGAFNQFNGNLSEPFLTSAAGHTQTNADAVIVYTGTTNAHTFPAGAAKGWRVIIANKGSGNVTTSVNYINGAGGSTNLIVPGALPDLIFDGTNWQQVGS